jgi:hypothetical protein
LITTSRPATYVLPIRRAANTPVDELASYLARIARRCDVIVVDGSDAVAFDQAHIAWSQIALHIAPESSIAGQNGKVRGVLTALGRSQHDRVVIADDDVRFGPAELERTIALLDDADLVRPQNYFDPLPWHARWDTARTLLNRAIDGVDFPGTLAVRRDVIASAGGYDANVLFENLELIRTVEAVGGRTVSPLNLYVSRRPPSTRAFWSQRIRQAYDEFARPHRLVIFLLIAPTVAGALGRRRVSPVALAALLSVAIAEAGRRRARGASVFPPSASWCAPLWLLERSVCSWFALAARLTGGCRYAGTKLQVAATPARELRRRIAARLPEQPRLTA